MGNQHTGFYVLSLDGGGSLGAYTLGVLTEIEQMLGTPLVETFSLIYGTSTGAIIGSMLALGHTAEDVWRRYCELGPAIVRPWRARSRSAALRDQAAGVFGKRGFDCFRTKVGIVAYNLTQKAPMVFKSHVDQLRTGKDSFKPGFGCSIADAVIASSAAYPFFERARIHSSFHGDCQVVDGGYMANNPSILALVDATGPLAVPPQRIRVLSVGTGMYTLKKGVRLRVLTWFKAGRTYVTLLDTSTQTMEWLEDAVYHRIQTVRVNGAYLGHKTNFLEADRRVLNEIYHLGRKSAVSKEEDLKELFSGES